MRCTMAELAGANTFDTSLDLKQLQVSLNCVTHNKKIVIVWDTNVSCNETCSKVVTSSEIPGRLLDGIIPQVSLHSQHTCTYVHT
jgi:hypothetical protein